ncbi:MAG: glycosyltransferase family 2 protein [Ruminococcus sp.]|nr:glycosyltransferase family 2 protein [Ruminococcus sp.]
MTEPLVSVIVPIYNAKQYLPQCIESVLNQSYNNIELILVDDGSTDNSFEVCNEYCKSDNRVIAVRQENTGVSGARNKGIDLAKGEYIAFVDSDDELMADGIKLLVEDAIKYDADMVSAVKRIINPDGSVYSPYDDGKCMIYEGVESVELSLDGERQTNSACAKLFKKSFLGDIRFAEGRSINEDGFFLFECYVKLPKLVQHNICIYNYYVRSNSSTRSGFSEKYFDMLYFCDRKREIINELFPQLNQKMTNQEVTTNIFFLEALCKTKDKAYTKYQKDSIKLIRKNYKSYTTMNEHERKMARIIRYGFYPLYKVAVRLVYYRGL